MITKKWRCSECETGCTILCTENPEEFLTCNDGDMEFIDIDNQEEKPLKVKFSEAIHQMKLGDSFDFGGEVLTMVEHSDDNEMTVFVSDQHGEYVLLEPEMLNKEGVIVKPGAKVLSAEESWEKTGNYILNEFAAKSAVYKIAFDNGHQNGRLHRDLELKPLLDFIGKHSPGDRIDITKLYAIYVDLKSLNGARYEDRS